MGRIVAVNFVSLDGVMQSPLSADEDPDGGFTAGGWAAAMSDPTVDEVMQKATISAAGMLLGRRTYDIFTEAWSQADATDAAITAMNRMPKYVVTQNTGPLKWANSQRLGESWRTESAACGNQPAETWSFSGLANCCGPWRKMT